MVKVVVALLIVLVLAAGYVLWRARQIAAAPSPALAVEAASAPAPAAPPAAQAAQAVIQHPIEAAAEAPAARLPEPPEAAMQRALVELLGARPVNLMLQTDGFVQRVVATVDSLGRAHAAPRLWPVTPMPGRFTVQRSGDAEQIAPANAARYAGFVGFVDSIDLVRAAALYKANYPSFQAAYRELGYPNGYFNDRLIEVIDLLLATPEPAPPIALRLIEVKGELPSTRPWVRYEFADPALDSLSAGQKMLVRMGNENAVRLKARLRAFRALVAKS